VIRLLPIALLLLASNAYALDLSVLQAAAETYPQDYGSQVRLARAADAALEHDIALDAWQQAFDVSDGNLETSLGRAMAFLGAARIREARVAAAAAALKFPDSAAAHKTHAWTLRQTIPYMPGTYGLVAAERAYERAWVLSPDDETLCGAAWTRLAINAPVRAREDFVALLLQDSGNPCAVDGTAATRPMFDFGGGFTLTGSLYQDHDTNKGGFNALIFGHVTFADLVFASVYGRFAGIAYDAGGGVQDYRQDEIWARIGVTHKGYGGQLLAGVVGTTSDTDAIPVLGWRGWANIGPTIRLEGTWTGYEDGNALRGGIGLRVPVQSWLAIDGGLDVSGLITTTGTTAPQVSAHLSGIVDVGRLTLQPGFRVGNELRPVRIDEPTVWNTTDILGASAFLKGAVNLNPNLDLTFGYEVLRLQPQDGSDVRHTHTLSIGISAVGSGGLRK
jgi:hypothetical protein